MNHIQEIKEDLDSFQNAVVHLSKGINSNSSIWKDNKYVELSSGITEIANQSRNIMIAGDKLCASISEFDNAAAENY